MSARSALMTLAGSVLLALAFSLVLRSAASGQAEDQAVETGAELGVEWAYRPDSLEELTVESPAIVLAEVEAVTAGELVTVGDPTVGESEVPSQLVQLRVVSEIEGETPETFTLYKLGGQGLHPEGSPSYAEGERYLLFVRRRLNDELTAPNADGTWVAVAPDGRLERLGSGELEAQTEGAVAEELDGETVSKAIEEIEAAEEGQ